MTRRQFLLSLCGAATTLAVLDACTREAVKRPAGRYPVPPEATVDPDAAREIIGGDDFVFDIQGHLLEYELNRPLQNNEGDYFFSRFPQQNCGAEDPRDCYSIEQFLDLMFVRSDTRMVVISALPIAPEGSPLSMEVMEETRRVASALCRDERVLLHAQALPNVGPLEANLDAMQKMVENNPVVAWKVFTNYPDLYHHNRNAWRFDDADPNLPQVGEAFIRKAIEVGRPTICSHKGFSRASPYATPADVGPAAKKHPDANFVIYHSGFEAGTTEGPYTAGTANLGINRLIDSVRKADIGPNENVYAELGSTWWYLMRSPEQAGHAIGKLLKYIGEDNVLWGTDCLFYGSPQDQIQAMRALEIPEEFQERYGYPKLTKEIKSKILGLNGARLYNVDPITVPCEFTPRELEEIRRQLPGRNETIGPRSRAEVGKFHEAHQGWPG